MEIWIWKNLKLSVLICVEQVTVKSLGKGNGEGTGDTIGVIVGTAVGATVTVGIAVGSVVGVGIDVGSIVGVGTSVGTTVGSRVGVGTSDGVGTATGSTLEEIRVELCSKCHPFYTGEQRFVDSASRIQKFQTKQNIAKQYLTKKVKKMDEQKQKDTAPKTLREMLMAVSK